jgi:Relaxase/Mobilisation nuclease domain
MIAKVHRLGTDLNGLVRYLFSNRDAHHNPHVIAAWLYATIDGPHELQPRVTATGRRSTTRLADLLDQPVWAALNPPAKPVWHCSIHNHASDPILSDQQWADISTEVMDSVGLAPHGDDAAVRWIAVRHADQHIHIVATRVRQDGYTVSLSHDYRRVQTAARQLEDRYGLHRVDPQPDAARLPQPAEIHKAQRQQRSGTPRQELCQRARHAAAVATSDIEYFQLLANAGVVVRLRAAQPADADGYAIGLPDFRTIDSQIIYYSGSRLAPDLGLGRLRRHWQSEQLTGQAPHPRIA